MSLSIIILKPNKVTYNFFRSFHSIILLNILEKLIEKVISKCFQYYLIVNNFIHSNQLGSLKQCSFTNTGLFLTNLDGFKILKQTY